MHALYYFSLYIIDNTATIIASAVPVSLIIIITGITVPAIIVLWITRLKVSRLLHVLHNILFKTVILQSENRKCEDIIIDTLL